MGLQDIEYICKNTTKSCDVHLMVTNPSVYVEKFIKLGASIVYVHPETDPPANPGFTLIIMTYSHRCNTSLTDSNDVQV